MDPPHGSRPWRPCLLHHPHHNLHHHHHHHPLFLCPLHHRHHHQVHHHHNHHFHHHGPNFASFLQNPEPPAAAAIPIPTHLNSEPSELKEAYYDYPTSQTLLEYGEVDDGWLEEEEDDDPVFVLTDEWKEFFAKSEAKRTLGTSSHSLLSTLSLYFWKIISAQPYAEITSPASRQHRVTDFYSMILCLVNVIPEKQQAKKKGKP